MTVKNPRLCGVSQVTAARLARENRDAPAGAGNTTRGLTHSSGTSREGLGVKPTRPTAASAADSLMGVAA
jgi:hypothetical protein